MYGGLVDILFNEDAMLTFVVFGYKWSILQNHITQNINCSICVEFRI